MTSTGSSLSMLGFSTHPPPLPVVVGFWCSSSMIKEQGRGLSLCFYRKLCKLEKLKGLEMKNNEIGKLTQKKEKL
jgi:hypothetical protein